METLQPIAEQKRFLFLQGPPTPFFAEIAAGLRRLGHQVHRVNLHLGDRLFWRGPGSVDFTGQPGEWADWIDRFMAKHAITDLILLGEQRPYHKTAIAAAKLRGIAISVTDLGYVRPDWITLERDGMGGDSLFPRDPAIIQRLAAELAPANLAQRFRDHFPTQALWDVSYHLAMLMPWPFRHYEYHERMHPLVVYAGLALRLLLRPFEIRRSEKLLTDLRERQAPFWVFAMQVETDFAVRAYSPYPDMDSALRAVIMSFAAHAPRDEELLVKLHPLDPCLKNWRSRLNLMARKAGMAGRVHLAPLGDLDAMLRAAKGMVTVNSTATVHAFSLAKPVKLLGRTIFDVSGLSFQGALDDFWTKAAAPEPTLRDAFFALLCSAYMVRGVYYRRPGLDAAVAATVERLDRGLINLPLPAGQPESATA
jgi:capsular polysaccharide export protein